MYAQFPLGSIFEISYSWGGSRRCEGHSSPVFSVIFLRQEGQAQMGRDKLLYSGGSLEARAGEAWCVGCMWGLVTAGPQDAGRSEFLTTRRV